MAFVNAARRIIDAIAFSSAFFRNQGNCGSMHRPHHVQGTFKGAVMKAEQQRLPRFAVLIDADNTSP